MLSILVFRWFQIKGREKEKENATEMKPCQHVTVFFYCNLLVLWYKSIAKLTG